MFSSFIKVELNKAVAFWPEFMQIYGTVDGLYKKIWCMMEIFAK